jgi:membrane protein DedA with SNARE-associated domain
MQQARRDRSGLRIAAHDVEQGAMTSFLTNEGYLALVIFCFIQACCIPISSEITFGFAGVLAYEHHLSLALVIIIGTLAEFAGSSVAYAIGRRGGRSAIEKYRRYLLLTRKDVDRVERFFDGRGTWSVAVARIIPLVRAFTGLVAGLVEVPTAPFAIFNLIGTLIWATALSLLGYAAGSDWAKVSKSWSYASDALAVGVLILLAVLVVHKWHQARKERQSEAAAVAAPVAEDTAAAGGRHRSPTDGQGG